MKRRLRAMCAHARLIILRPVPWFPGIVPFGQQNRSVGHGLTVEDLPMFYLPLILKHLDSHWIDRCVTRAARRWDRSERPDLIDAHFGYPTGVGCYRVGRRLGIPVFITLRGVEETDLEDRRIGPQLVEALSNCAGVIAVSDSLKAAATRHGVPPEQIRVIPNAVEMDHFHPGNRQVARHRLGLPADVPIIVSVGSLIQRKGHHTLVQAFGLLKRQAPQALLVIVGAEAHEPRYPAQLRRTVEECGLGKSVRLPGSAEPDAVQDWLHAADVFSLATSREGCCNAVLEALACGRPVVTTPAGDNTRYVDPPKNGLIVPFNDSEALAKALRTALDRPWDADAISQSVRSRTWDDVARETIEFFEERVTAGL